MHSLVFPGLVCPRCSYDLRGLPAARCPECGVAFDPSRLRRRATPVVEVIAAVISVVIALWLVGRCAYLSVAYIHEAIPPNYFCGTTLGYIERAYVFAIPLYIAILGVAWLVAKKGRVALIVTRCAFLAAFVAWFTSGITVVLLVIYAAA